MTKLEREIQALTDRVLRLEELGAVRIQGLATASGKPLVSKTLLRPGDRVEYITPRGRSLWAGMVIPMVAGVAQCGLEGIFVHVLRDGDRAIRACYPWNLRFVA